MVQTFIGDGPGYADGASWQARFCGPNALAILPDGTLYVTDSRNHRIRKIAPSGEVATVAGSGPPQGAGGRADGTAAASAFRYPSGIAAAADGTLYVSDTGNHRVCRIRQGRVDTLAGSPDGSPGKADGTGTAARFRYPAALALDASGALWVADLGNSAIRRIDPTGRAATTSEVPQPVREALGDLEKAPAPRRMVAWGGDDEGPEPREVEFAIGRLSGETRAPGSRLTLPRLAGDEDHHVLVMRRGDRFALLAGRRDQDGVIPGLDDETGLRAKFALPCAVAVAEDGTAYVAEYEGNRIRKVVLPQWLVGGSLSPPERRRFGRWRRGS